MILKTKYQILNWLKEKNDVHMCEYHLHDISQYIKEIDHQDIDLMNRVKGYIKSGHEFLVNIEGNFILSFEKISKIPIQFHHINGFFECSNNQLISLEGSPYQVSKNFKVCDNNLKSLKGAPQYVGDDFDCAYNQLKSLEFVPTHIGKTFFANHNILDNLRFFPDYVGEDCDLSSNSYLEKYLKNPVMYEFDFDFWKEIQQQECCLYNHQKILNQIVISHHVKSIKKL